jgi:hypothetical protein
MSLPYNLSLKANVNVLSVPVSNKQKKLPGIVKVTEEKSRTRILNIEESADQIRNTGLEDPDYVRILLVLY